MATAATVVTVVALLYSVVLPIPVQAWGCTGHMLVAEIAQRHLSASSRAKANALSEAFAESGPFPRNPDMVQAACWPDDLKSWHQYAMKPWHYVDIPYNPDNLTVLPSPFVGLAVEPSGEVAEASPSETGDKQRRARSQSPMAYVRPSPFFSYKWFARVAEDGENGGNVVTSIRHMVVALKASKVPLYSLNFAFANLLHFVGDAHQPLHATTRYSRKYPNGDRGGNSVKVKVDGVETNLHALWDNMCLSAKTHSLKRPLSDDDYESIKAVADVLEDTYKFTPELIAESVAAAMAWESHMFAINTSYPDVVEGEELTKAYLSRCRATAEARVTLAGLRLGKMLDEILQAMDLADVVGRHRSTRATQSAFHVRDEVAWWRLW